VRVLVFANMLTIVSAIVVTPVNGAPPSSVDLSLAPWFRSLKQPGSRNLCCDIADCRNHPVQADGERYLVWYEGRWLKVPAEAVSDRTDNPTGDYVSCVQRDHWTAGEPDGPLVLCLFRPPRM
jgi:hypothetical protein